MDKKFIGVFDDSMLQNMDEFDKRYLKTYIWIETENEADYWFYHGLGYAPGIHKLILKHPNKGNLFVSTETNAIVNVKLPESGLFNHPAHSQTCIFTRKPHRQWKRGLCKENAHIEFFFTDTFSKKLYSGLGFDAVTLRAALDKHFVPFETALQLIEGDHSSVAINNMVAVSRPVLVKDQRPCIWLYKNLIGLVNTKEKTVCPDPMYKQEIIDLLKGTQWKLE